MSMGMMTVYHGGYKAVKKPEIRIGRNTKDFGNGFLLYSYQRAGSALGKKI